jgi:Lrp/AsnC family leucine-responsive transcriptional regulator
MLPRAQRDAQQNGRNDAGSSVIDVIDRAILGELARNGRATFAELGRAVNLSPNAVADRVRRLLAAGVVRGVHASIDFGAVGRGLDAYVDVRLHAATDPDEFERRVGAMPAVREIAFVTGRFDYQLHVACEGADDLDYTLRRLRRDAGAAATETRIVLRVTTHFPPIGP